MIFEPFKPFLACAYPDQIRHRSAGSAQGARRCAAQVFCDEQRMFDGDDRDAVDDDGHPDRRDLAAWRRRRRRGRHRAHPRGGDPASGGARGSRSTGEYRRHRRDRRRADPARGVLGPRARLPHVSRATCRARMSPLFRRLHWRTLEEVELHGRPHHVMQADLDFYPPFRTARGRLPVAAEAGGMMIGAR